MALREPFLAGPIPWSWLAAAKSLPGQALAVGLALWHLRGLHRSDTFPYSHRHPRLRDLGVSDQAARRALRALEAAGLAESRPLPGRGLAVTIRVAGRDRARDGDNGP